MKRKNLAFCLAVCAAVLCITAWLLADIHRGESTLPVPASSVSAQA